MKRSHKRHIILPAILCALAVPAAAMAAGGEKIGLSSAVAVEVAPLATPLASFHSAIHSSREKREAEAREEARERRERFAALPGGVSHETLEAIAACESGGDPRVVSADGSYRGKYQFDFGTWESVGGSGDPAAAPEDEQDYRAALLYARSGSSPWPVCG